MQAGRQVAGSTAAIIIWLSLCNDSLAIIIIMYLQKNICKIFLQANMYQRDQDLQAYGDRGCIATLLVRACRSSEDDDKESRHRR